MGIALSALLLVARVRAQGARLVFGREVCS